MRTAPGEATGVQHAGSLRLAPLPPDVDAPDDRLFAHAFGGPRRVLGFGGRLVGGEDALWLEQFVLCASGKPPAGALAHGACELGRRLERAGWRRTGDDAWAAGPFELVRVVGDGAAGDRLVHLVLTRGAPDEQLYRRVLAGVTGQTQSLAQETSGPMPPECLDAPPETPGPACSIEALAEALADGPAVVYTGAGVSRASGIATFEGAGSLDECIPLIDDFPGAVLDWIVDRPERLAAILGRFQASLQVASPNGAHRALVRLERQGAVRLVITNNFDRLHERAGSRRVFRDDEAARRALGAAAPRLLIVAGVSIDERGIVGGFRADGARVIAIGPERPPFLSASEAHVPGPAEAVLPRLVLTLDARIAAPRERPPAPCSAAGFASLVALVAEAATTGGSSLHGDGHWRRVAWIGRRLAGAVPGCDAWIVLLFALLHDAQRENDGHDPAHGARAAGLARRLARGALELDAARLGLLEAACFAHADGGVSRDPTVGVCWDADRLDLWRCAMTPDPRFLSSLPSLDPATIGWSRRERMRAPGWDELYALYAALPRRGAPLGADG